MKGLLEEGQELMDGADAGALRDALMITDGRARIFFCSDACKDRYQARTA